MHVIEAVLLCFVSLESQFFHPNSTRGQRFQPEKALLLRGLERLGDGYWFDSRQVWKSMRFSESADVSATVIHQAQNSANCDVTCLKDFPSTRSHFSPVSPWLYQVACISPKLVDKRCWICTVFSTCILQKVRYAPISLFITGIFFRSDLDSITGVMQHLSQLKLPFSRWEIRCKDSLWVELVRSTRNLHSSCIFSCVDVPHVKMIFEVCKLSLCHLSQVSQCTGLKRQ